MTDDQLVCEDYREIDSVCQIQCLKLGEDKVRKCTETRSVTEGFGFTGSRKIQGNLRGSIPSTHVFFQKSTGADLWILVVQVKVIIKQGELAVE